MNYDLALELKNAGFPYKNVWYDTVYPEGIEQPTYMPWSIIPDSDQGIRAPTLEELIEACGAQFNDLSKAPDGTKYWRATSNTKEAFGNTPTEAVARLWLALQKK